jgi:Raf kinase inhibitor-like YbhB/YbcL family protein
VAVSASRHFFSTFRCGLLIGPAIIALILIGCDGSGDEPKAPLTISLNSANVKNGMINKANSCDGQGLSPHLSWSVPPPNTRSLALIVTDRDSPLGLGFVHWVVYNIAPSTSQLPAGLPIQPKLPDGAVQGLSGSDRPGYQPPCPHGTSIHRYDFVLYALDSDVNLPSATKKQLLGAIRDHVIAKGDLVARYGR